MKQLKAIFLPAILLAGLAVLPAKSGLADDAPTLEDRISGFLTPIKDPLGADRILAKNLGSDKLRPASCPSIPVKDHKFTAQEIVVLSLCNSPNLRSAYLSLATSADSAALAYSVYLPTVTASASVDRSRSWPGGDPSISRSSGMGSTWTLFDFGQRELGIEISELTMIAAGHSYSSTLQGAIASALQQYYSLLTAQSSVAIAEESERFALASYEAAKLRHEIGQVARADVLQAQNSYTQAAISTQSAKNQLAIAKGTMARLLGLPPDENITMAELNDSSLMIEPFGGKVTELIAEAKEKRVDLKAQRIELENAKIDLQKTQRQNLGSVSIDTSGSLSTNRFLRGGSSKSNSITLSVSIPIFTAFNNTYNERIAKRSLEQQKITLQEAELDIEQDVWNSWHNYQTSQLTWDNSFDQLRTATELKDITLERYKLGLGTILDLLSAQSQYSSALQSHLDTRYNLLTSRIDLVRAVGALDLETMQPTPLTKTTVMPQQAEPVGLMPPESPSVENVAPISEEQTEHQAP